MKMNKGMIIRSLIKEGLTNEIILQQVDTTVNSVRWHRSKMQKSTRLRTPRPEGLSRPFTVGMALEHHGLVAEVRACLERLEVDNPELLYTRLARWSFKMNGRAHRRYGQCDHAAQKIEIHKVLLDHPTDLRKTFLHECAHALDKMIHGRSSQHGGPWQHIMSTGFLLPPTRCGDHTAEASAALSDLRVVKAIETWICTRCGHEASIQRKRKYPAHTYAHNKCGGRFKVKY